MNIYELDVSARLDYGVKWTKWLAGPDKDDDDVIVASSWVVDPGITHNDETFDAHSTTLFLTNGTLGTTYEVTNHITTFKGRVQERTFGVIVVDPAN